MTNLRDGLIIVLTWVQDLGAVGAFAFIGFYILATVLCIPGSLLTLGAGLVFGVVAGSAYVFVGATLGATAAFLIGRYLVRGWVTKRLAGNEKFQAIDEAVEESGLQIVLLTRLSPVFPFTLLNYAYGVTSVSLRDYLWGCIGMLPGTVMYVYLGSLAGNLAAIGAAKSTANNQVEWAFRLLGFAATVAVSLYVASIARRALAKTVDKAG
jgi:uncharacterized membrane protein YdjX (TVP38/TMEM64 family)